MTTTLVKATSYLNKGGKLVNRNSFSRTIQRKLTLSQSKRRVKALNAALDRLQSLTKLDKDKLEYALILNKTKKSGNLTAIKGYIREENGRKIPTVNIPKVDNQRKKWILHSHPDEAPLSLGDVLAVDKKGGTIFAIDKEGSVYRATNKRSQSRQAILDTYDLARQKISNTGIAKDLYAVKQVTNPEIDSSVHKLHIQAVIQHKLLTNLHNKGLIHYRAKLSPDAKKRLDEYKSIMDIELKRNTFWLSNFKITNGIKYVK